MTLPHIPNGENLDDMLRFDPLAAAEQITGKHYACSPETTGWGLMLMMTNSAKKEAALKELDDTILSDTIANHLRIVESMGFKRLLEMDFVKQGKYDTEPRNEKFFIHWHEDGLLMAADTYFGHKRNSAKVWYNWRPNDLNAYWNVISSGRLEFDDKLPSKWTADDKSADVGRPMHWAGDHDAREAIRHKIAKLRENGSFLRPWKTQPFLWLLHHGDTVGTDYRDTSHEKINAERLAMLPDYVRECVQPKEEA